VLLLAAIVSEVTGSLALKGALEHRGWYAVVAVGYVASFVLLGAVLRRGLPLGVAYGIWGALGVAATAVMSAMLFDEALTVPMALGLVLVIAGVLVVELGHQAAVRAEAAEGAR
jgi:small multidrug resistance pump